MATPRLIQPMRRPGEHPAERYGRPTRAEIDLEAIVHNAERLKDVVGPAVGLLAVVKADAYGHGAVPVARALVNDAPIAGLAVSLLEEGVELRRAGVPGLILVMGAVYTHAHVDVLAHDLTPVIGDIADVEAFSRAASLRGQRARVHVKIDTGMSRLGVRADDVPALIAALARAPHVEVVGLMTHLSSADAPGEAGERTTAAQLARFAGATAALAAAGIQPAMLHAGNSAATVRFPHARFNAVRPGLALYGGGPDADALGLVPAMRLSSGITQLRTVGAGDSVSYGAHFTATAATRVATVPMGYADGYPRRVNLPGADAPAEVLVRGRRCPVLGTVCMDMIMVDVTALGDIVSIGDEVVLLGAQGDARIGAAELAARAGLLEYEITCGVSKRVPRAYRNARG